MNIDKLYTSGRVLALCGGLLITAGICTAGLIAFAVPFPFSKSLIIIMPIVLLYGIPAYAGRFLCRFFPADWVHLRSTISAQVVFTGAADLVLTGVWILYGITINLLRPDYLSTGTLLRILPIVTAGGLLILIFAQIGHYGILMFRDKKQASEELLAQKLATAEAELALVKSTIHPHFLFNSLSMLRSLVRSDPAAAGKALEDLSEFLVFNVTYARQKEVLFKDEMTHARRYAELERLRGIHEFTLAVAVPEHTLECKVPPFIVQPLLENALKHGIQGGPQRGEISINAGIRDSYLHITVSNPLPGDITPEIRLGKRAGSGLLTLEKRLYSRYGSQARLEIQTSEQSFTVNLKIPLETRST